MSALKDGAICPQCNCEVYQGECKWYAEHPEKFPADLEGEARLEKLRQLVLTHATELVENCKAKHDAILGNKATEQEPEASEL